VRERQVAGSLRYASSVYRPCGSDRFEIHGSDLSFIPRCRSRCRDSPSTGSTHRKEASLNRS
jgi:hypothetical protein